MQDLINIPILEEEDEMYTRFHNENAIYLYCTLERQSADTIIKTNKYNIPIYLYETKAISEAMSVNLQAPVTLRVALNLSVDTNEYYYDSLTMRDESIQNRFKLKSIEEYKKKCVYERSLITCNKTKVIQYKVNYSNKLLANPQYV